MKGLNDFTINTYLLMEEEFEDTKGIIRIRTSKKDRH
jgi:hypothetical protein